jgi:hypothetical protein
MNDEFIQDSMGAKWELIYDGGSTTLVAGAIW